MKRMSLLLLRTALLVFVTYELGIVLAVFIIRRTPMMPYWMDMTIRYVLEAVRAEINDPWDISTIGLIGIFVVSWLVVGVLVFGLFQIAVRLINGRPRA
ncbi:hypothetical protein AWB80_02643 [Caballeronia pedi]|uniref:Uncharacterized protein n=1 Tax=Caballeronia pedi TaxID=1777141 RepID=A0A158ATX7_9BURK|nr:hypothetical protein [Caballeronia pedi]SAK61100.1 hypothetical protein AWB80_02643 [Caballeronia pedi]